MDKKTKEHFKEAEAKIEEAMRRLVEKMLDDRYQGTVFRRRHQDIVTALRRCAVFLEEAIPFLPEEKRKETAAYLGAIALTLSEEDLIDD